MAEAHADLLQPDPARENLFEVDAVDSVIERPAGLVVDDDVHRGGVGRLRMGRFQKRRQNQIVVAAGVEASQGIALGVEPGQELAQSLQVGVIRVLDHELAHGAIGEFKARLKPAGENLQVVHADVGS